MGGAGALVGLTLVAASLPFVLALFTALRPGLRPSGLDDYFLYSRSLTSGEFLRTSVGYSLQVAAIVLFFFWTFSYGLRALFVPLAWGGGYLALRWGVRRGALDGFLKNAEHSDRRTIHGYLGQVSAGKLQSQRHLVLAAALTTVVGLAGTLLAEVDYATDLALQALRIAPGIAGIVAVHVAVLAFTGCYVLWGGYKAVVDTDLLQVPAAYSAFGAVLIGVCALASPRHTGVAMMVLLALIAMFLAFYRSRIRIKKEDPTYSLNIDRLVFWGLPTIAAFVVFYLWDRHGPPSLQSRALFFPPSGLFLGFGVIGVLALTLANAIWQFVDISSLQRLQSVEFSADTPADLERSRHRISVGLGTASFETCGAWIVIMLMALALRAAGVGTPDAIGTFLGGLRGPAILLLPTLIFAAFVFMMSTIDGLISAMAFVAYYDLCPAEVRNAPGANSGANGLRVARWVTLVTLALIYVGYLILRTALENRIDAVLYAIYALQISLAPVVGLAFFRRRSLVAGPAVGAIVAGWAMALSTALSEVPWFGIRAESWYVAPPLAAFVGSTATYFLLYASVRLKDIVWRVRSGPRSSSG